MKSGRLASNLFPFRYLLIILQSTLHNPNYRHRQCRKTKLECVVEQHHKEYIVIQEKCVPGKYRLWDMYSWKRRFSIFHFVRNDTVVILRAVYVCGWKVMGRCGLDGNVLKKAR